MNLTSKGQCGWHKCFFPSTSNTSVGYLIAEEKQHRQILDSIQIALDLERQFGSKHFHLDLSVEKSVTEDLRRTLNALVEQPGRAVRGKPPLPIYKSTTSLTIEKVLVAPRKALFLANAKANLQLTVDQLADFRQQISDPTAFAKQLHQEYRRLENVFQFKPELSLDFQALVDTTGNLFHIDLDGHYSMAKRGQYNDKSVPECLLLVQQVLRNLTATGNIGGFE